MTVLLATYSLLTQLVTWLVLVPWTLARRALGRTTASELSERLGRLPTLPAPAEQTKRILIHAVSVGEMAAAEALVGSLARFLPDLEIILTAGNRHGREAARRVASRHSQVLSVSYLPWDRRGALRRWLDLARPDLVAIVETEIWPNLFFACRELGVHLCVVNGRIYPADLSRYRLATRFFRPVLACVDWFGVQSPKDKERFVAIGADPGKIDIEPNLKYEVTGEHTPVVGLFPPNRRVLLAGSTHAPEEKWLLQAFAGLRRTFPELLLALAPRHPRRAAGIAGLARRHGLSVALSSGGPAPDNCDALVVDQMGLLPSLYARAEVVFVGGSLARRGGHNPLEPAAAARCVVMGPHYEHFVDIVEDLRAAGALLLVTDPGSLESTLRHALKDEIFRTDIGQRAQATLRSRAGCSDRYAQKLASMLRTAPARRS
jgi:3-deoxy-D-manno-octulosonic-acid transferase